MHYIFYVFIFFLGTIIGSFLNVCIYRLPREESTVTKFSYCPGCRHRLYSRDLVPLFSYLFLGGRCRYCGALISPRYILVETFTGILYVLALAEMGLEPLLLKYLVIFSLLVVIIFIDLDHKIIPNPLVAALLSWGLLWQVLDPEITWAGALAGALLGGGSLLLVAVVSRGGMGGGDIKLMLAAGFFLGPALTTLALFLGFFSGALVGVALILLKKVTRKDYIPFGPFLSAGIIVAALWGQELVAIYLGML